MSSATAAPADLSTLDLGDHAHWTDGPPYELFAQMRREQPVHWSPNDRFPDEDGFWSVTRADLVHAATRDFTTFSSERRGIFLVDDVGVPLDVQRLQMISMDPPRHDRMKKLVGKAFTPGRIAEHEHVVRRIVQTVLDRFTDHDHVDLVTDIAQPVPARVIGSLLGTPESDDRRLVHWTNVATAFEDPAIRATWGDSLEEIMQVVAYIEAVRQERVEHLGDDLLSALITAEVDGDRLTEMEIATFFVLLLAAGNDSTRATYSATMLALMEDEEQRRLLVEDPSRIPAAVEEGLRCFPAFGMMGRAATRDVELGGAQIREGDRVLLWYIASNRDPALYPDRPDAFDLTREGLDRHQAFGAGGRHFCLGASLARMELRIWIEETLARWPDMRLDGDPTRIRSLFLNQYTHIPVALR
ncbi:cytochrome P450 [Paraconexibacter algicola]|uniref:Cytochrome P450 n=2 Tax=Solirubrobacterales TaxID=588673 RepID=A0A2T4UKB3_9ACTN|nr:cytochrome P450 [Paraconexibacter algicola]PTL59670.1 cytochrome P450 [Paraconexibacter algicola]